MTINMAIELEKASSKETPSVIISFVSELVKTSTKRDIVLALLTTLNSMLQVKFLSFIEKEDDFLKVTCQMGEDTYIKSAFSPSMCKEIFNWVMNQKKSMSLRLTEKEQFVFVPIMDRYMNKDIEHGIVVLHLNNSNFEFSKELNVNLDILGKLSALYLTRLLQTSELNKHLILQEKTKSEMLHVSKIFKTISNSSNCKKMSFAILEDKDSNFSGNVWWVDELDNNVGLVFVGTFHGIPTGMPRAMLSAYLLGEMNSLKTREKLLLQPADVFNHLNSQLNLIFKTTGVSLNAWYGVFNLDKKSVRFANANHADPFVIGPELVVTNLAIEKKEIPLGVNIDSIYTESYLNISSGSKLVICTKNLLERASKIGDKYDPSWLPQVLETVGNLPINEMCNSLECILSENLNGTAPIMSRLALLLEMPS